MVVELITITVGYQVTNASSSYLYFIHFVHIIAILLVLFMALYLHMPMVNYSDFATCNYTSNYLLTTAFQCELIQLSPAHPIEDSYVRGLTMWGSLALYKFMDYGS